MSLQDTALRLIKKFGEGRTVILQVPNAAPGDPTKPWDVDPTSATSNKTAPAVVIPIDRRLIDGNSVLDGDETILIAGISLGKVVPKPNAKVLDEGVEKNIISVDRIRPGKTDFLYKLQVRAP